MAKHVGEAGVLLMLPVLTLADSASFNIPVQPLSSALQAFAIQANMQLLYPYSAVAKIRANAISGDLDKHEALTRLLRGTGFEAKFVADNIVTIEPVKNAGKDGRVNTSAIAPMEHAEPQIMAANDPAHIPFFLEEIIVTTQKREERLQDVPVPVVAVTASELADKSQFRMQDYYTQIPGLALTPNQFGGASSVAIRGITSGDTTNPTVGITVDDVPFGSSTSIGGGYFAPDFDPSDLARVEVLRGPQGTLYGAASIGGLIKYITNDPTTDVLKGRLQLGLNSVSHGHRPGYNISAGLNVPVNDSLALRANGFSREEPGYIDNIRGSSARDVNKTRGFGGHLAAVWQPSSDVSLRLSALMQHNKVFGAPYVTIAPGVGELQQDFLPASGVVERRFQAYGATAQFKFDRVALTSVTGYSISHLADNLDYTTLFGSFTQVAFGTRDTLNTDDTTTYKFSQELRAVVQLGERIDLLGGGYYTREYSPYRLEAFAASPDGRKLNMGIRSTFFSTFREWAGFANFTYRFTDRLDVQIGGRRSEIRQSFGETDIGPFVPLLMGKPSPRLLPEDAVSETATTYLVTPRFKWSSGVMIYARLASGYRPGGINQGDLAGLPPTFSPDKTQNYEIGLKGSFLNNRLFLDGSVYYIDWKDIQLSLVNPLNGQNYFTNGSHAKSEGVELSIRLQATKRLQVNGWAVWNNAQLTEAMPLPEQGGVNGPAGARLPFSSQLSANAAVNYEFPVGVLDGVVGSTVSQVGKRVGVFVADDSPRQVFPAYTRMDVHAGVRTDEWTFDLYLNNVTDKRGLLGGGNGTITPTAFQVMQPRTVGVSVARTF